VAGHTLSETGYNEPILPVQRHDLSAKLMFSKGPGNLSETELCTPSVSGFLDPSYNQQ
jgi:hypothetical protein